MELAAVALIIILLAIKGLAAIVGSLFVLAGGILLYIIFLVIGFIVGNSALAPDFLNSVGDLINQIFTWVSNHVKR